jgi:hypothetical protein
LDEENQTLDVSFKQMATDVEGLSEDVSSQGTQLSVIQGQIESKVWQQDIDTAKGEMSTKYSTLEQTVEGFKTTVSETYAKKEDLENIDIGDMSIGGRNLLIDTNSAKSVDHIVTWNPDNDYAEIVYHDSYTDIVSTYTGVVQIVPNMTYGWYIFYRNAFVDWLKPDTDYVVSFDIQFSGWNDDTYGVFPQIGIGNTQSQHMQAPYATASEIEPDTGLWAHVSCNLRTVALIPEGKPLSEQALCIIFGSSTCIIDFAIKNLKLEEGTVPTAWTPAPEDNATKGDIETLTTKYAEFEQSVEGFKTTVGETYATKKELDAIDLDVEIGGRNYLIGTSEELQTFTFSGEAQNVTTFTVSPDILPKLGQGQKVTLSAFIENVTDTNEVGLMLMVYTPDTDSGYRQYTPINSDGAVIAPSESGTAYVTTTLDVSTVTSVAIALRHNSATTEESTVNIRSIKLELGDQVTDWTPAPEDTDNALGNLSTETNDSFDNLNDRIVLAESTIQQLKDCISMLVVDSDGKTLLEQTSSGWTFNLEDIRTSINNVSKNMDTLLSDLGDVESVVDALDAAVEDLGKTAEYVKIMTYESEPCIALGKRDSVFKLLITNTRIMFLDGDNVPTYINTTGLVTENITVNNEIIQGGWVWKKRANGNYGLIWRGDG